MRELFFVRHGQAASDAPGGDPARPLTHEGREAIAGVGRALARFGLRAPALIHSPYLRAEQTAQVLASSLSPSSMEPSASLTPEASVERALQALTQSKAMTLVVVSHMPLLPKLVGELAGARVEFATGTVAHIALMGPRSAALLGLWSADKLALIR